MGQSFTLIGIVLASVFLGYLIGYLIGSNVPGVQTAPVSPAQSPFLVSNLSIQPAEVRPSEPVTITISVANTHDTWGIYSLVLKINGIKEAEKSVTIAAGSSDIVTFSVSKEQAGSYSVTIDSLSASFTVVAPTPEEVAPPKEGEAVPEVPAKAPTNWPLIGGIIGGVIVVGLLVYFLVIRRRVA